MSDRDDWFCLHGVWNEDCVVCSFKDGNVTEKDFVEDNYLERMVKILWPV